jgi:sulfonate transport system substrate-binding protein
MTRLILGALAAVAALGAAGCGDDDAGAGGSGTNSSGERVTLRVGVQKDGIRAVLQQSGQLKNLPYDVKFSTFQFGPPLVEAAGADKIDLAWVGNTPPIFGAAAKSNFKIIAAVHEHDSQENSLLVPKGSDIKGPEDLEGKKVAVAKGSSAQGFALSALKRVGADQTKVKWVYLPPADGLAAFKGGQVDAWVVWDPFTIQAEQELGAKPVIGGEPDEGGLGFEIASAKALEDDAKKKAINDYVNRLAKAWQWAEEHPDEWAAAWSKDTKLPLSVTKKGARVKASDLVPIDDAIIERQQKLADLLTESKVLPGKVEFKDIVDPDVVELKE